MAMFQPGPDRVIVGALEALGLALRIRHQSQVDALAELDRVTEIYRDADRQDVWLEVHLAEAAIDAALLRFGVETR